MCIQSKLKLLKKTEICRRTSLSHGLGRFAHGLRDPHVGPHRLSGVAGRRDLARRHVRPLLLLPQLNKLLRQHCASRLLGDNSIRLFHLWLYSIRAGK